MVQEEFKKQSKDCFNSLFLSEELPMPNMTIEEASAIHYGVACDNCGVYPIRGPRYKCSVRKNYDLCSICEDRLEHEHPLLRLTKPGCAPDVMITILGEEQPAEESKADKNDPM